DAEAHADCRPNGRGQATADGGAGDNHRDARTGRTGGLVDDGRLQASLLATAVEVAAPGDKGGPDRKSATHRPQEEPGGNRAKHANANCKSRIPGHLTPLSCESGGCAEMPAVHRLNGLEAASIAESDSAPAAMVVEESPNTTPIPWFCPIR